MGIIATALGNLVLGLQGSVIAGSIQALTAFLYGSLILQGHMFFDMTNNTTPAIYANTGAVMRIADGRSSIVFTNSGGRVNYTAATYLNSTTGTQSLLHFNVDFNKAPVGTNDLTCGIGPSGFTTSGSAFTAQPYTFIFKHKPYGSGSTVTASGSYARMIPPNWQARCWTLVAPGAGIKAKMRLILQDQYIP